MRHIIRYLILSLSLLFIAGCGGTTATFVDNNVYTGNITNTTTINNVYNNITYMNSSAGWADYVDTQYNSSNVFTATGGNTVHFPNNGGTIRGDYIPQYINNSGGFYNGTYFIGRNGDAYGFAIRGKATPANANTYCEFNINISGAVGNLPLRLLTFAKGAGNTVSFEFATLQYTLDTWESNGGNVTVNCNNNVEFYDISYKFAAMYRANQTQPILKSDVSNFVNKSGDVMQGNLDFNGYNITNTSFISSDNWDNVSITTGQIRDYNVSGGGGSNSTCPVGYECPTTYAELLTMSISDNGLGIWGDKNGTYTENGNDWVISVDKVIKMNGATIVYDTSGCSGGNIHPYTNKNIEIYDLTLEGNGCSTAMFYNVTSGSGTFKAHNINILDVPAKTTTLYFAKANLYNWNLSNVQAGITFDNSNIGHYIIDTVYSTWDNTTSTTESELIDINHLEGYAKITNIYSGTEGNYNSFAENVIDCNILNCVVEDVEIWNNPTHSTGQSLVYLDTTQAGDKVFHVNRVTIHDLCNNMIGVRLGGSTTSGYDTGTVSNSNIKGCNTNSSTNNAGIRVAGNMIDVKLITNNVNGTYYGVLSSVGELELIGNSLQGTAKDWHDSAASATRQTNLRYDLDTMQSGTSGYICIDNPIREWILTRGATC